jgi:hypothetical protein
LLRVFIFLVCLCFTWNAHADDPDRLISYPPQTIMGFRGLDARSTKPTIADSRASDLLNVKLSAALDLRKRFGYSVINDTLDDLDQDSPSINMIFDSEYSTGTSHTYAVIGTKLKYDNSGTWTTVSGVALTDGKNNQAKCVMALDFMVCTNDTDEPFKSNVTPVASELDFTGLTSPITKARTVVWHRNYLIFGNTFENSTERPTRFRWSNVGAIQTWSDDDFVDLATFAGDEIIGFAEIYGELYIFLEASIWKASLVGGDDVFVFTKIVDGIGAGSTHAIKVINLADNRSAVIFSTDKKRVRMFTGASAIDIGGRIQDKLDLLNESRLANAVATFDENEYILCASTSGITTNDICYAYQTEINEWTSYDGIDANAIAQVRETDKKVKTYFGNYKGFVYWMDNPDLKNDVDGASGVFDSEALIDVDTITAATILIDADITAGNYTGATVKIVSGTGVGQEGVVIQSTSTGLVVTSSFSTSIDSTSGYSVGGIDAYYTAKPYDLGDAAREKQFLGMLFWAAEASNTEVTVSYAEDFGSTVGSETISLSPTASSLWDTALWDTGVWGTTGDKLYTSKFTGFGNFIEPKFENNDIDKGFHLYGFNLLAIQGDVKQ